MPYQFTLYDAFSGIPPHEKAKVIHFLCDQSSHANRQNVLEAVEYALKLKPSFGGFVLAAKNDGQLAGVIVANRTGMEGYNPKHIFVFVALDKALEEDEVQARCLLQKALHYADGDVAVHLEPGHPTLQLYQQLGFQAQYLELRFPQNKPAAVA